MKCQKCNDRKASILIRQTINGVDYEYKICQECAQTLGLWDAVNMSPDFFTGGSFFVPTMFPKNKQDGKTQNISDAGYVPETPEKTVCEGCNITLDEIRKTGRVGCAKCYDNFQEAIIEVFRRVQSGERHRGRIKAHPAESIEIRILRDEISQLRDKIKDAVKKEDYESAAEYKSGILKNEEQIGKIARSQEEAGKEDEDK